MCASVCYVLRLHRGRGVTDGAGVGRAATLWPIQEMSRWTEVSYRREGGDYPSHPLLVSSRLHVVADRRHPGTAALYYIIITIHRRHSCQSWPLPVNNQPNANDFVIPLPALLSCSCIYVHTCHSSLSPGPLSARTVQLLVMSSDNDTSSSASSSSSSSSTLSSINSQLLTHGWAKRPLNLDALSEKQHNDVVSVLFELLGASVVSRYCPFNCPA